APSQQVRVPSRALTLTEPLTPPIFDLTAGSTTVIYTLSLHDALPIFPQAGEATGSPSFASTVVSRRFIATASVLALVYAVAWARSEEHMSELQSQSKLVCRLLLEKKKRSVKAALLYVRT